MNKRAPRGALLFFSHYSYLRLRRKYIICDSCRVYHTDRSRSVYHIRPGGYIISASGAPFLFFDNLPSDSCFFTSGVI